MRSQAGDISHNITPRLKPEHARGPPREVARDVRRPRPRARARAARQHHAIRHRATPRPRARVRVAGRRRGKNDAALFGDGRGEAAERVVAAVARGDPEAHVVLVRHGVQRLAGPFAREDVRHRLGRIELADRSVGAGAAAVAWGANGSVDGRSRPRRGGATWIFRGAGSFELDRGDGQIARGCGGTAGLA